MIIEELDKIESLNVDFREYAKSILDLYESKLEIRARELNTTLNNSDDSCINFLNSFFSDSPKKKIQGDNDAKIFALGACSFVIITCRQRIGSISHNHILFNLLVIAEMSSMFSALSDSAQMRGEIKSHLARMGALAKLSKDLKQSEKSEVKDCWDAWQKAPGQYKNNTKFANAMIDKFRPDNPDDESKHLSSVKVITDWCAEWKAQK